MKEKNKDFFALVVGEPLYDALTLMMQVAAQTGVLHKILTEKPNGAEILNDMVEYAKIMDTEGHKRGWCKATTCGHAKET